VIFFVVAAGTPSGVARVLPSLGAALARTRLVAGEQVQHVGAAGTWALAAISEPDPVCATRLASDADAMVVVNGPVLAADGNQSDLAHNVLRAYRSGGSRAVADRLDGTYNFVGVAPGIGLCGFGDWSGLTPLYWHAASDVVLLSNRSLTIEHVIGPAGWDEHALGWVLAHVNLVGDLLPATDVRYVPPGRQLRADWSAANARTERSPTWIWPETAEDAGRDNLTAAEWDDVTESLVEYMRRIGTLQQVLDLGLTGGKDSRLCLALAKAAGLGDAVTTVTTGHTENAVARAVAGAAGVPHYDGRDARLSHTPAARASAPQATGADTTAWDRLQHNIGRYEGIVCAWSALQNAIAPSPLSLKGFGGEFFRRGNDKAFWQRNVGGMDTAFVEYHRARDVLGVVPPPEALRQDEWLAEWVDGNTAEIRFDLLPEKFYVDFRLGHWSGPNLQCAPQRVMVNPLALRAAAIKNTELSVRARNVERFHFEVMQRAAPELVALPFYKDAWSPEVVATSSIDPPSASIPVKAPAPADARPVPLARRLRAFVGASAAGKSLRSAVRRKPAASAAPVASARPAPPARTSNDAWSLLDNERDRIHLVLEEAARATNIGMICDVDKVRATLRDEGPIRRLGVAREITNVIGVALTLLPDSPP
jgi:hypothetical protein